MKRLFRPLLLWAGLTSGIAYGQTVQNSEYFLDIDPGPGSGIPIDIAASASIDQNFSLNTTGLSEGLHKVYIRSRQDNGLWGIPKFRMIYVSNPENQELITFNTNIIAAEYYYDKDPGPGKGFAIPIQKSSSVDKNWVAKTTGLTEGNHLLYIRTRSLDGFWGVPDTIHVNINNTVCAVPNVDFSFDTVDINSNVGLFDLSTNVNASATYKWDVNDDGQIESTSQTITTQFATRGIYPVRLTITNPDGCSASILKEVPVTGGFAPEISLSANDSIISGSEITLTAAAGYAYEWNTGETSQSITVSEAGAYYTYLSADGITYKSETINVKVFEPLTTDFQSFDATPGLNNGAARFDNIQSDGLPYQIIWSDGSSNVLSVKGLAPGSYSATITTDLDSYVFPFTIANTEPASNALIAAEFFIGNDPGPGNGTAISIYQAETLEVGYNLDLSNYTPGLYKIYTRVKAVSGIWSIPKYRHFYVIDPAAKVYEPFDFDIVRAEYFFDADPGIGKGTKISFTSGKDINVDFGYTVNNLSSGLHELYVRTQNSGGLWSIGEPITFFVIGGRFDEIITFKTDIIQAEYFFDTDPGPGKGMALPVQKSATVDNRPWAAKTDGLAVGDHKLYIRAKSQSGVWNIVFEQTVTVNSATCVTPVADFSFDTVGVETLIGLVDLSTNLSDSVSYAWDIFGDGNVESTDAGFDTTFNTKGVYPLKLTVKNLRDGCFSSVVKDIYITDGLDNEILSNKADSLIAGDSVTFTAPAGYAYEWNTGATTQSITVGKSGTYYTWLSADGISIKSKAKTVNYFQPISADLVVNNASQGQSNGTARLNNIQSDGLPFSIEWSTGAVDQTYQSGLSIGSYQVRVYNMLDTVSYIFSVSEVVLQGTEIVAAEYFMQDDPGPGNGTPISTYQADEVNFDFSLDVADLPIGIHKIYLRTKQADGLWGIPKTRFFYVIDPDHKVYQEVNRNVVAVEYFIDKDPGVGRGTILTTSPSKSVTDGFGLNTNGLTNGLHYLYLRSKQDDGIWSAIRRVSFFVIDASKNDAFYFQGDIVAAEYFFDKDPGTGKGFSIPIQKSDTIENRPWSASTAGLEVGRHKLSLRIQNQDGLWTIIKNTDVFIYPSDCNLPIADFTFDTVGINTPIGLVDLSTNLEPGATYQWDVLGDSDIESTSAAFDLTFPETGVFPIRLTVTNTEGCFTSIVKDVIISDNVPGVLTYTGNDTLLVGQSLVITAPAGYEYEWNTGDTTSSISVTETGRYYAYLKNSNVTFRSNQIDAKFYHPIKYDLQVYNATNGLPNGAILLDSLNADGLPLSITWSTGVQEVSEIQGLTAGTYDITLTTPLQTVTESVTINTASAPEGSIVALEYFIDEDPGPGFGTSIPSYQYPSVSGVVSIDFNEITDGTHYVYIRAKKDDGIWGIPTKKSFYIISAGGPLANLTYGGNITYAEYAVDVLPTPGSGTAIPITAGMSLDQPLALDVSALSVGNHKLYLQVQDESGNWSMSTPTVFTVCNNVPAAPVVASQSACAASNFTFTVPNPDGTIKWYDENGNLLQSSTTTSYTLYAVQQSTIIYVEQTNAEGCTSARTEVNATIPTAQVYAGPDVTTYSYLSAVQLSEEYPKGGNWSGSSFVNASGLFNPKSSGVGIFNTTYSVDSAGCTLTDQRQVIVSILDNNAPVITDLEILANENMTSGLSLGHIIATDAENDPLSYFGASATDTSVVAINQLTGEITVRDSSYFDHEVHTSLSINIVVKDPYFETTGTIIISIQNVNEAPAIEPLLSAEIPEGSAVNTPVIQLNGTDPDGDKLNYTILNGNPNEAFAIDNSTGEITVNNPAALIYDQTPFFTLVVETSDGQLSVFSAITVNLLPVIKSISEADSLALVALYQSTGGDNWINKSGWLSGKLETWYGVTVTLPYVESISLEANNLTGSVSETFLEIANLTTLNLKGNQLTGVPPINQISGLSQIDLSDNLLDFGDLEPIMATSATLVVSPQKTALTQVSSIAELGSSITLSRGIDGTTNTYTWYKDNQIIANSGPDLVISSVAFENEGEYYAEVTNLLVPGLTIRTNPINLKVSSLERDRLALLAIHSALGGSGWNEGSNWPTTDISTWSRITIQNNRVIGLNLSGNNALGVVPDDINDLLELQTVAMNNNLISGLPEITLPKVTSFNVSNNKLQFDDLENNMDVPGIQYSGQSTVGTARNEKLPEGTPVTLDITVGGSANKYTWKLTNDSLNTVTVVNNASLSKLDIAAINYATMGTYQLTVTNNLVPGLTLSSPKQELLATADLSIAAKDLSNAAFTNGKGYALKFVAKGSPYDSVQTVTGGAQLADQFVFNDLVLGDYLVAIRPNNLDQFITTYSPGTDLWEDASTLKLRSDRNQQMKMVQIPPDLPIDPDAGVINGLVESELSGDTTSNGRILSRKKVKRAACSMRRFVASGRITENGKYELYAYVESDDDGKFTFENIEAGKYRLNIEYPGIPMDTTSFVEFEIGADGVEKNTLTLVAVVTDDGIVVEKIEELGFYRKYFKDLEIYPIPANQEMTVRYTKLLHDGVLLRMIDLQGRKVLEQHLTRGYNQEFKLDVSSIPDGIYLVNFVDLTDHNKTVITYRVVITHR